VEEEIGGVLRLHSHCYVKEKEERRGNGRRVVGWRREAGGDGEENFQSWF
jgi:hypothetical protein